MAEQLAVEVDVKNVMEYTAAAAEQALVFDLDNLVDATSPQWKL